MPEISRFLGISICLYRDDHAPPHFHAHYNDWEAQITIQNARLLRGKLPPRVLGYVIEWAVQREAELLRAWEAAQSSQPLGKIDPLV